MLLKRLEVENWRGLSTPVVVPFSDTVTVIGGPNESGKSSLRQALRAALLMPGTARGDKKILEAARPWDSKLCPRVSLSFEAAGDLWEVEKTFLLARNWATLRRAGRLVAEDGEVGPMLRTALGPAAEWIDVLWGEQGEKVREADLGVPESIKGRLAAAARETVTPAVAQLETRIGKEFEKYWTEQRMAPKKILQDARAEVQAREKRLADVVAVLAEADARTASLENDRRALSTLRQRIETLDAVVAQGMASLGAWETYDKNCVEADAAKKSVDAVERWMQSWDRLLDAVVTLWPRALEWRARLTALEAELTAAPSRAAIDDRAARLKFVELLMCEDDARRLASLSVPTAEELRRVNDAAASLQEVNAYLRGSELQVRFTASADLSMTLERDGDEPEVYDMQRDQTADFPVDRTFAITLPGVARLEVSSGDPRIAEMVTQREAHEAAVSEALQRFAVDSVDALVERAGEADALRRSLAARRFSADALATARARVGDVAALEALGAEGWRGLLDRLPGELEEAEAAWRAGQATFERLTAEHRQLTVSNVETELKHAVDAVRRALEQAPAPCGLRVPGDTGAPAAAASVPAGPPSPSGALAPAAPPSPTAGPLPVSGALAPPAPPSPTGALAPAAPLSPTAGPLSVSGALAPAAPPSPTGALAPAAPLSPSGPPASASPLAAAKFPAAPTPAAPPSPSAGPAAATEGAAAPPSPFAGPASAADGSAAPPSPSAGPAAFAEGAAAPPSPSAGPAAFAEGASAEPSPSAGPAAAAGGSSGAVVDAAFVEALGTDAWRHPLAGELERLREAWRKASALAVRPEGEVFNRARLDALQEERRQLSEEADQSNARVQQALGAIQAQGDLYVQKVAAVEELARARGDLERLELDAFSVRALQLAFTAARERLQQDVVAPLQARVGERFEALTRGGYRGVSYDAGFRLSGIVPARLTAASASLSTAPASPTSGPPLAPANDLSLGTLEQLMLLTRLSLGEMLSEDGKQVVVLDDNLVHTDEGRMALACDMLEAAAARLQIVIFTCHPERYRFAGPVGRVDLPRR